MSATRNVVIPSVNKKPTFREIAKAAPFIIRFIYQAAPKSFILYLTASLLQAPLASVSIIATKHIADALAGHMPGTALQWTWVLIGTLAGGMVTEYFTEVHSDILRYRLEYVRDERTMSLMASLPYSIIERTEFRVLSDAFLRKSYVMMNMSQSGFWGIYQLASLVGLSTVFFLIPWQVDVIIAFAVVVRVIMNNREGMWGWSLFQQENREGRRAQYIDSILKSPFALMAVKGWDLQRTFLKQWRSLTQGLLKGRIRDAHLMGQGLAVVEILNMVGTGAGLILIIQAVEQGTVSVGAATVFLISFNSMWSSLGRLLSNIRALQREGAFLVVVRDFFSLMPEADIGSALPKEPLLISFEDVWFRYPGSVTDALRGVSFILTEGEHAALVGLNGAGKSTILKLLMGAYKPTKGRILVNGRDLDTIKPSEWRRALAMLSQDVPRFDDTLRNQILYGDFSKKQNTLRMETAIHSSGLSEVMSEAPKGLETHAGKQYSMPEDEALELSGGQNQLIGIARTLYRDARVYVFDEPTAAVDAEKEERFFESLPSVLQSKAVLFVSHRFSTLRRAGRIIVIDDGRVLEEGSHDELMAKRGRYAELFTLQAKMYQ